ncbi:O-antigen ligase family protein [Candidatus Peregrinibacteria bacterium]|nr:O-antigen ligase family protein [Candidatus Peregrinibacteria bacterium]
MTKSIQTIAALIGIGLIAFFTLSNPELSINLTLIICFALLSWFRPMYALALLLIMPIAGEFSRLELFGRSIVLSDLAVPIFTLLVIIPRHQKFQKILASHKQLKTGTYLLIIFLLIAALSLFNSLTSIPLSQILSGGQYLLRLFFYILLFPATLILAEEKPHNSRIIIKLIIASGLLIAISGFIQLAILPSLEELAKTEGYDPHINRLVGSWLDPNYIGGFLALIISLCISLALQIQKTRLRIYLFLIIALLGTALFLTYSRSAYLALAFSILIIGLLRARTVLIIAIILGTIGISSSDRAQQRVGELATSVGAIFFNSSENPDPTARLRILSWEQTINLIKEKPLLGHGYNNLSYVKTEAGYLKDNSSHSASGSDSSILTLLATTGIIGTIPFLFFLIHLVWISWKNFQSKIPFSSGLGLGLLSGTLGLLLHSNFVNSLFFAPIMIFLWILFGLNYSTTSNSTQSQ